MPCTLTLVRIVHRGLQMQCLFSFTSLGKFFTLFNKYLRLLAFAGASMSVMVMAHLASAQGVLPRPDHIVIVIEENHSYQQIIVSKDAPYMNMLARQGASFTNSHGETHPSQPNYIVLFSGDDQDVSNDDTPHTFNADNLASGLAAHSS
jgi:hypothetical protein